MATLSGKKIAILTEKGFEEVELTSPKKALEEAGATVDIVSPEQSVRAMKEKDWSIELPVDVNVKEAKQEDYDGLLIPGGVINPDLMRINEDCVKFVRSFFEAGKPVAAICHGPQLLIEAGVVSGKTLTSYPSIKTDLKNAGANWVDKEVVVDNGLITSRSPKDLPAFNKKIVEEFREGVHAGMHA
ncbi:type 1 glutamine amidotransferase domain-containing protein [Segetibacter koreensis]|uniref:type 1 glutamine amidotransferase domain-containing protein n=1 Tax=Segetibacter koreensis TaxID=398037 RepID=UPI000475FD03|nr:type 1 glutamine amidotransferase domain-containing protein [Segetibacter koreensis]